MQPPDNPDALWLAVQIQLHREPRDWPKALESLPVEFRAEAEAYLRGIAARMWVVRSLRRE